MEEHLRVQHFWIATSADEAMARVGYVSIPGTALRDAIVAGALASASYPAAGTADRGSMYFFGPLSSLVS